MTAQWQLAFIEEVFAVGSGASSAAKASGAVARVLAGESEVEIFSMLARFNFKGLGFDVSGSLTSPVED